MSKETQSLKATVGKGAFCEFNSPTQVVVVNFLCGKILPEGRGIDGLFVKKEPLQKCYLTLNWKVLYLSLKYHKSISLIDTQKFLYCVVPARTVAIS